MLHGTAMAIAVGWSLTILTVLYFKNFCRNRNILTMILTKKFVLQDSLRYTSEMEKPAKTTQFQRQ